MFKQKYYPFDADMFFDVYATCNVGCSFCKFNKKASFPIKNDFDALIFAGKRVMISHGTEPLPFADNSHTAEIIESLHQVGASVLFLSRFPKRVCDILNVFNSQDIVGVSISEASKNDFDAIKSFLLSAKQKGISTWLSIEPIETFEFADFVLSEFENLATYLRCGKLDCSQDNLKEWNEIKQKIQQTHKNSNIFVKDCQ